MCLNSLSPSTYSPEASKQPVVTVSIHLNFKAAKCMRENRHTSLHMKSNNKEGYPSHTMYKC